MRGLAAAFLLLAASQASAEWLKVDEHAGAFLYFDPETVAKDGIFRKMWTLQDRKVPDHDVLSRRAQWEFNCKEAQVRLLSFTAHSEAMGKGKTLRKDNEAGPWEPVAAKTTHETLLNLACAR